MQTGNILILTCKLSLLSPPPPIPQLLYKFATLQKHNKNGMVPSLMKLLVKVNVLKYRCKLVIYCSPAAGKMLTLYICHNCATFILTDLTHSTWSYLHNFDMYKNRFVHKVYYTHLLCDSRTCFSIEHAIL